MNMQMIQISEPRTSRPTSLPEPVVQLCKAGKRYGQRWAIQNVDMTLRPGEILGFIGPNGAGKTTLMKLMAGLSRATEGEITVLGHRLDGQSPRTPTGIGLIMEQIGFIPYLSGYNNLVSLARIRGVADAEAIRSTLELVGLDPQDRRAVRSYSLGMRQRLGLAQALMEQPRLLLLDEPTNGLDPAGIVDLRRLLRQLAQEGTAIFLASHLLTEVEQVCDRVLLVRQGQVIKEIIPSAMGTTQVRVIVSGESDADHLAGWAWQTSTTIKRSDANSGRPVLLLDTDMPVPQIVRGLVSAGVNIEEIGLIRQSLEEEFMTLVSSTQAP